MLEQTDLSKRFLEILCPVVSATRRLQNILDVHTVIQGSFLQFFSLKGSSLLTMCMYNEPEPPQPFENRHALTLCAN